MTKHDGPSAADDPAMALEHAYEMLETNGVPRARARTVANGIEVLRQRLSRQVNANSERARFYRDAAPKLNDTVCQILGKALGYPWFKDDDANCPGATAAHGVCVGDHVAESIAEEAAAAITAARWQPIGTAPRDGTILLYSHSHEAVLPCSWVPDAGCWQARYGTSYLGLWFEPDEVSHWAPIPLAPAADQRGALCATSLTSAEGGQ